jgi:membrane protease YdiL (CAAX protease family)
MELNLPGGDQALEQMLQRYPVVLLAQAALVTASLALNVALLVLAISNRGLLTRHRLVAPPWIFSRGMEIMARYGLIFFSVMILAMIARQEFSAPLARWGLSALHVTAMALALSQLLCVGLVMIFMRNLRRESGVSAASYWLGPRAGSVRRALLGIVVFVLVLAPVGLLMLLAQVVFHQLGWKFDPQPLVSQLHQTDAVWFVVVLSVFAVVVAPLVEEIFFRGILYPTLRQKWGVVPGVLLTATVFALLHFHPPTFLPLFALAVFLCLAFEYTGSLPACILAHSLFNSLSIIAIWLLRSLR